MKHVKDKSNESDVREWQEMKCDNAVRVNGCADEGPYYEMPWAEGPIGPYWSTQTWCVECIEDDPIAHIDEETDEVVVDTSEIDTEYDEVRASQITENGNISKD